VEKSLNPPSHGWKNKTLEEMGTICESKLKNEINKVRDLRHSTPKCIGSKLSRNIMASGRTRGIFTFLKNEYQRNNTKFETKPPHLI
jgi:hypothetical protein